MQNLDRFEELSNSKLETVSGGTILGYVGGWIIGAGGKAWGKMHKDNPGMPSSAING